MLMAVQNPHLIDQVIHEAGTDTVVLCMLEPRDWGDQGALLGDLERKLSTYLAYVKTGRLGTDFRSMRGKPVRFELRCVNPPTRKELDFLEAAVRQNLEPNQISFQWRFVPKTPDGSAPGNQSGST